MKTRPLAYAVLTILLFGSFVQPPAYGRPDAGAVEPVSLPVWDNLALVTGVQIYPHHMPALALDPGGRPHVVFGNTTLYHGWYDGAVWQREIVDGLRSPVSTAVLVVDAAGRIFIASIDNGRASLFTREPGGAWQERLLPLPAGLVELSIALDSGQQPFIAGGYDFNESKRAFYLAHSEAAGWKAEAVPTTADTGGSLSLAVDRTGQPVVLYAQAEQSQGSLWLARRTAGGWRHEQVSPICGISNLSLAIDDAGRAHVAFSDACDRHLTYGRESGQGWELALVADAGLFPSLALDAAGRPHVAFKDDQRGLAVAEQSASGWDVTLVQAGEDAGWHNTLVIDAVGTAHVVSVKEGLHYATNPSGTWVVSLIAGNLWVGQANALALDADDTPLVLYDIAQAGELWWGTRHGDEWATGLLAAVAVDGLEVALAVDSADTPYIAYVDSKADRLVAGWKQGDTWVLESIGAGGTNLSLAIGSDDRPQIILTVRGEERYWIRDNGAWASEPVGGIPAGVQAAFLALDSRNRPHIAGTNDGGVWHAVRLSPGNWSVEWLALENIVGLALGPQDQLYILHEFIEYWDRHLPTLMVTLLLLVQGEPDVWHEYVVYAAENWGGGDPQLVVSGDQRAHVAFADDRGNTAYQWVDPDGAWGREVVSWSNLSDLNLVLGSDGQPRLLSSDFSNLILSTRRVVWLGQASFLPVVPR